MSAGILIGIGAIGVGWVALHRNVAGSPAGNAAQSTGSPSAGDDVNHMPTVQQDNGTVVGQAMNDLPPGQYTVTGSSPEGCGRSDLQTLLVDDLGLKLNPTGATGSESSTSMSTPVLGQMDPSGPPPKDGEPVATTVAEAQPTMFASDEYTMMKFGSVKGLTPRQRSLALGDFGPMSGGVW